MGDRGIRPGAGYIDIDYTFQGQRRRERLPWRATPRNVAKARLLKAELEEAQTPLDLFRVYARSHPESRFHRGDLIEHLLVAWLEQQTGLAPSTRRDYLNSVEHFLVPAFGHLHIQELRWRHVRDFLAQHPDLTAKRRNNVLIPLRQVCARAVEDEQLPASPFTGRAIGGKKSEHRPDPFTPAEVAVLLPACPPQLATLVQFACWSGLRTGELIGLEWGDVDWVQGFLRVRHNVAGGVLKGPKTEAGVRDVLLLPAAREALTRQKAHTFLAGGRVFHDPVTGLPWLNDTAIRKRWMPAMKRSGVRYRRPYSTRDTYASTLLSAGEDPAWVATQMGHRDFFVLRRSYAAWIDAVGKGGSRILALAASTQRQSGGGEAG